MTYEDNTESVFGQISERLGTITDPRWTPLYITLLFLVLFLSVVGALFIGSLTLGIGEDAGITYADVSEILFNWETAVLIGNTIVIGVGGGLLGTAMGAIYAWLTVRTNMPGGRIFKFIVVLPLSMPFIVKGIGWISVLSPSYGIVNQFTQQVFGFTLFNIYSIWGIILAIGVGGLPLAFLVIEPAVRSIDPALEEGSRIAGRGLLSTFFRVTLPMLFPALFSAFMLLMIFGLGNFDYPFLLGAAQGGIDTLATEIFMVVFGSAIPDYTAAGLYSIIYVLIAFVSITIYWYSTRQSHKYQTVSGGSRQTVHKLGKWKYVASSFCAFLWGISFLPPFIGMLFMSLSPSIGDVFTEFTVANYINLFALPSLRTVIINTIIASLIAATLTAIFGTFISYTSVRYDRFTGLGDYVSTIPLGFPPIVYGLAIFWLILLVPFFNSLYGTLAPVILALVFIRLPHGVRMITSSLIQISDDLDEASSISGASWTTTFRKITIPLVRSGISNAWLYSFIGSMRELGAIILLITAGNNVFTGFLLQMYNQDASALPTVAAGSMVLFLLILCFVIAYELLGEGKYSAEV